MITRLHERNTQKRNEITDLNKTSIYKAKLSYDEAEKHNNKHTAHLLEKPAQFSTKKKYMKNSAANSNE